MPDNLVIRHHNKALIRRQAVILREDTQVVHKVVPATGFNHHHRNNRPCIVAAIPIIIPMQVKLAPLIIKILVRFIFFSWVPEWFCTMYCYLDLFDFFFHSFFQSPNLFILTPHLVYIVIQAVQNTVCMLFSHLIEFYYYNLVC